MEWIYLLWFIFYLRQFLFLGLLMYANEVELEEKENYLR